MDVSVDDFALALDGILGDVGSAVNEAVPVAAEKSGKDGAKRVRKNAAATFGGKRYKRSWGCKSGRSGQLSYAEIGSTMPGLPHLLEKGHATLGGGRVPGRPHIAPAAEETFEQFERELSEEIERVLGE